MIERPSPYDPPTDGRRGAAVRGGILTLSSRLGVDGVRLLSTAVLSRLLGPTAFGLLAVVQGTVGVAQVLRDGGLATATVRQPDLQREHVSTSYWINVGLGAAAALLVLVGAPLIGDIAGDQRVVPLARGLAITFVLGGVATQHLALMTRRTDYRGQSFIELAAAVTHGATAAAFAVAGAGAWSLVWGLVAASAVTLLLARRRSSFRPGMPVWTPVTAAMVRFGAQIAGFAVLGFLGQNLHLVLIGSTLGIEAAGVYGRAQTAFLLAAGFMATVPTRVAVPHLARVTTDPIAFARAYRGALRGVVLLAAGLAAFTGLHATRVISILLGSQWGEAVPLLTVLSIGIFVNPLCASTGWIFIARGHGMRMLRWGAVGWSLQIIGALCGLPFGLIGVATGYTVALVILTPFCLWYAFRDTELTVPTIARDALPPTLCAAVTALLTAPFSGLLGAGLVDGAIAAASFGIVYLGTLLVWPSTRSTLLEFHGLIRPSRDSSRR